MTENQAIYKANCSMSKALCAKLERLTEDVDYYEKALNNEHVQACKDEIDNIHDQLNSLWNIQIDLFFQIQDDYRRKLRDEVESRFIDQSNPNTI
jgi:hypothetical protein